MMESNKIRILYTFEMLGRPKEHLTKTLEEFIEAILKIKGVKLNNKKIHEPKLMSEEDKKGQKTPEDLFTIFAEVELIIDEFNLIFDIVFNMLPAHVEVIDPKSLSINNFDLSAILSGLTMRLHRYDEVAKTLTLERKVLINKIQELENKINKLENKNNQSLENKDNQSSETKESN